MARKSKFKPEYTQRLRDFFNIKAGEDVEVENSNGDVKIIRKANPLPLYQAFAKEIGVTYNTLRNWSVAADDDGNLLYPEFAEAYGEAVSQQYRILVENGLLGGYQQAFAIFTAKNILGWRDALSHEHTGKGGSAMKLITTNMSPQEAAEAYADTLNGD